MATYRVKSVPGFENILVVGKPCYLHDGAGGIIALAVERIINTGVVIGDRELEQAPLDRVMYFNFTNLELVDDSGAPHEFAYDNPYGEFKYQGRFEKGDLTITHGVFENAVSITIYEQQRTTAAKTLYTASFFNNRAAALEMVEAMLHNNLDPDDLIFELQKLKETDYDG